MGKKKEQALERTLAAVIAPEDISVGDYVGVLGTVYDLVGPPACAGLQGVVVHRVELIPSETAPPFLVEAVCLPFLLVRDAAGAGRVVDVRRFRLARVPRGFGARVFRALRGAPTGPVD